MSLPSTHWRLPVASHQKVEDFYLGKEGIALDETTFDVLLDYVNAQEKNILRMMRDMVPLTLKHITVAVLTGQQNYLRSKSVEEVQD